MQIRISQIRINKNLSLKILNLYSRNKKIYQYLIHRFKMNYHLIIIQLLIIEIHHNGRLFKNNLRLQINIQ